jgi:hypothetical protein
MLSPVRYQQTASRQFFHKMPQQRELSEVADSSDLLNLHYRPPFT